MRVRSLVVASLVAGLCWSGVAAAASPIPAFLTREQPIPTNWTFSTLSRSLPNDPDRCVSFSFGEWKRVKYATGYSVTFDPSPEGAALGSRPVSGNITDNAVYEVRGAGGKLVRRRNPSPPTGLLTPLGAVTWGADVARLLLGSYSTGRGCGEATRPLLPFTASRAVATLSVPVRWVKPDPEFDVDDVPADAKGAVMRVTEVDGGILHRRRGNRTQRIGFGDYIRVGDILTVSKGGAAALEMVTGGRIGISGDSAFLVLSENQVKNLSRGRLDDATRKAAKIWEKVSVPRAPMDVSTGIAGAMTIKG